MCEDPCCVKDPCVCQDKVGFSLCLTLEMLDLTISGCLLGTSNGRTFTAFNFPAMDGTYCMIVGKQADEGPDCLKLEVITNYTVTTGGYTLQRYNGNFTLPRTPDILPYVIVFNSTGGTGSTLTYYTNVPGIGSCTLNDLAGTIVIPGCPSMSDYYGYSGTTDVVFTYLDDDITMNSCGTGGYKNTVVGTATVEVTRVILP